MTISRATAVYRMPALIVVFVVLVVSGCNAMRAANDDESGGELQTILRNRCGMCHVVPPVDALPQSAWVSFLGRKSEIMTEFANRNGRDPATLPSLEELETVRRLLNQSAKTQERLTGPPVPIATHAVNFHVVAKVQLDLNSRVEGYTDIFVDEASQQLLAADVVRGGIQAFGFDGRPHWFEPLGPTVTRLASHSTKLLVTLMEGTDGGRILSAALPRPARDNSSIMLAGLSRPIRAYGATLFLRSGIVVEEFGDQGGLSFWPDGSAASRIDLIRAEGVVGSAVHDFDGDGLPEIVVLIDQEQEQLAILRTSATGVEARQTIFRGHPGFGFNGLVVADVDGDGMSDILTMNGDNYDIDTAPLKPYHGLRIYYNRGDLQFEPGDLIPMHGVIDAVVGDFDNDGDADIAAVSAFPDYRLQPYESAFLYEQTRPGTFEPRLLSETTGSRWIAVEAFDKDGDGDLDIALAGARSASTVADRQWSAQASPDAAKFMVLENRQCDTGRRCVR